MSGKQYCSWGGYPVAVDQRGVRIDWRHEALPLDQLNPGETALPFGQGRSYGDACLNDGGLLFDMRHLNRFIAFDQENGIITCEAGVLISEILDVVVPKGWFPTVTPGTKLVTVGGAIANDVHGKNHHRAGSFGHHVRRFELVRSDGERMICSPNENSEWFRATIGGLGLTGVILWAELQLRPIVNPWFDSETIRYDDLAGFFALSAESDSDYEYTLSWLDCAATGKSLGRGHFMRGNHNAESSSQGPNAPGKRKSVAITPPFPLVNRLTLKVFNFLYYTRQLSRSKKRLEHFDTFFYPLDAINNWNRIYGRKGFLQYQCVLPTDQAEGASREILERVSASRSGSFLAVMKMFGDHPPAGLLTFPRKGCTLSLDFPFRGRETLDLLDSLDTIVVQVGGAIYPAKDARMAPESFAQFFPNLDQFRSFVDPALSSSLWRRLGGPATDQTSSGEGGGS
ncbi:MAG: FAD-binding oxidoreductase [Magnetococcales bacterium]|nr:FAD-binding oxidoreductase [Magnetococcales bacterium]